MSAVHAGWLATQGLVRVGGGTIQTVFRTVVGTALGSISVLAPLLQAALHGGLATLNPVMVSQALLGLGSIGLSIAALVEARLGQQEASDALRGANMALHGVQSLLGVFDFA